MTSKIAYLKTNFWFGRTVGGSVAHTAGVVRGFLEQGCKVSFIGPVLAEAIPEQAEYIEIKARFITKVHPAWGELLYNFYSAKKLQKVLKHIDPDFVYFRQTGNYYVVMNVCKRLGFPVVLEFNSSDYWAMKNWKDEKGIPVLSALDKLMRISIVKRIEEYNLRNSSYITVVSDILKDELIARGIDRNKILVNPNAVDAGRFERIDEDEVKKIRQEHGLEEKIVVGFIGTFKEFHGIYVLVDAIKEFTRRHNDDKVRFLLIGKGPLKGYAEKELHDYSNVLFKGAVPFDHVPVWGEVMDILLSPHVPNPDGSRFFGSPVKIFEYMATGKAIVASRLEQIAEILEHNTTALLVSTQNVNELCDAIDTLIQNPGLREKLGDNARKEVIENYTWKKHCKRILEFVNREEHHSS